MTLKVNYHQQYVGNDHGEISFGPYRSANELAAVKIENKHDAGRHYIVMQQTGDRNVGIRGSTKVYCPGLFEVRAGKDIKNYSKNSNNPENQQAIFYEAENGDIVLSAPRGKIKFQAEAIEINAKGFDGKTGVVEITADEKVVVNAQNVDIQGKVSTKIFSEKTVELIGYNIINIYGGLISLADRSTKGSKPSKSCQKPGGGGYLQASSNQKVSTNESRHKGK